MTAVKRYLPRTELGGETILQVYDAGTELIPICCFLGNVCFMKWCHIR